MDPQSQISELLEKYDFDLVRQRKHKVYRNPDGLIFVTSSTPSDWRSSRNALSTLKRILREPNASLGQILMSPAAMVTERATNASPMPAEVPEAMVSSPCTEMPDQEWEAWKRRYWHDEKLRAKNETFLSAVQKYVNRVSDLIFERKDVHPLPATGAVKSFLRGLQYKSKVLLYDTAFYSQGVLLLEAKDQPILWASNGHIGVSAYLPCRTYVQHGPSKAERLRFDWDGMPVSFELPERSGRKFYFPLP